MLANRLGKNITENTRWTGFNGMIIGTLLKVNVQKMCRQCRAEIGELVWRSQNNGMKPPSNLKKKNTKRPNQENVSEEYEKPIFDYEHHGFSCRKKLQPNTKCIRRN